MLELTSVAAVDSLEAPHGAIRNLRGFRTSYLGTARQEASGSLTEAGTHRKRIAPRLTIGISKNSNARPNFKD